VGSTEADAYCREEVSFLSLVANQVLAVYDALNFDASQLTEEGEGEGTGFCQEGQ
jgi:hypothetical protein